jgi:SAM-dependent methyltransferase
VDFASHEAASRNLAADSKVTVKFADLLGDLTALGKFDLIYCQEVLHHTADPFFAFRNLRSLLAENGEIAIYVYKKKAVLREFADDYIRERISHLTYQQSHEVINEITEFAREVSKMPGKINFPGIKSLGVRAQETTLHRFIYNNFFKNFWNEQLTFEENFSINFDWYHTQLSSRHTKDEVEGWFLECGLSIVHSLEDDFGVTVRGVSQHIPD